MNHLFFATLFEAKPFISSSMKKIAESPEIYEGEFRVIIIGTGLVQAAINCTKYFQRIKIQHSDEFINLGIAGSTMDEPIGSVSKIKKICIFTNEKIPESSLSIWEESYPRIKCENKGKSLASSLHPVWDEHSKKTLKKTKIDMIDMEGYSFAKVCEEFSVSYTLYKSVSDNLNKKSQADFLENASIAIRSLFNYYSDLE